LFKVTGVREVIYSRVYFVYPGKRMENDEVAPYTGKELRGDFIT
jgi:hypothetical protein